jgi:hypothetical protein
VSAPEEGADVRELPDEAVRDRIVRLAFGGDAEHYARFVDAVRAAIPPDVTVVLRGSVVTGQRWEDGRPFDADGPGTSDLDLTLVGGDMLKLYERFYLPALHSVPLSDEAPDVAPTLAPLRRALCAMVGRPVNIQATSDLVQYARDVLLDQPYFVVVDRDERRHELPAWERELEARRAARPDAGDAGDAGDDAGAGPAGA